MEKKKPTFLLEDIKRLLEEKNWEPTGTALKDAFKLGLSQYDIEQIVLKLTPKDFYKSMTSYKNHKVWQDVYYKEIDHDGEALTLYIKIQIKQGGGYAVIISFKKGN